MSATEAKAVGMVRVGEWGFTGSNAGHIQASKAGMIMVRIAYDAIEEGDMGPDVLAPVFAAGGVYIPE